MRIRLNGETREVEEGLDLSALLAGLERRPGTVAIAVNAAVVPRDEIAGRRLAEGDEVENIEAVGGG